MAIQDTSTPNPALTIDFNLRLAHHFVVLVEEGSFSSAADRLFLTQSALSKQIQNLERLAGRDIRFIDRSCRPWQLTSTGRAFLQLCNDILRRAGEHPIYGLR